MTIFNGNFVQNFCAGFFQQKMLLFKTHTEHTSVQKPLNYPVKYLQIMDSFVNAHNLYTKESSGKKSRKILKIRFAETAQPLWVLSLFFSHLTVTAPPYSLLRTEMAHPSVGRPLSISQQKSKRKLSDIFRACRKEGRKAKHKSFL